MPGKTKYKDAEKLLDDYQQKLITRAEIIQKTGINYFALSSMLKRRKIKIWDRENHKNLDEVVDLALKVGVKEAAAVSGISEVSIENALKYRKLSDERNNKGKIKKAKSKNPYFDWREECSRSSYARTFYQYNKISGVD